MFMGSLPVKVSQVAQPHVHKHHIAHKNTYLLKAKCGSRFGVSPLCICSVHGVLASKEGCQAICPFGKAFLP